MLRFPARTQSPKTLADILKTHETMNIFKSLFGQKSDKNQEPKRVEPEYTIEEKLKHKVYPRIKNIESQNFDRVYHKPLGGDLTLTFVQDINDRLTYIQNQEAEQLKHLIDEWEHI